MKTKSGASFLNRIIPIACKIFLFVAYMKRCPLKGYQLHNECSIIQRRQEKRKKDNKNIFSIKYSYFSGNVTSSIIISLSRYFLSIIFNF